MRYFDECVDRGKNAKETLCMMDMQEARLIMDALEFKINTLPKNKTKKEQVLLKDMEEKWGVYPTNIKLNK